MESFVALDCCPDSTQLQKYLLGQLPGAQFDSVDSHISQCHRCAQAISDSPRQADLLTSQLSRLPADTELGDYELLLRLGHGGMGRVYRARHRTLNVDFAVKIIRAELKDDLHFADRFQREVQALSQVRSPNVVSPVHAGTWRGTAFLAMELVDGCDLESAVRQRGVLGLADSSEIIAQIANGLSAIHEGGLVHRDIHPGNLLLGRDGVVKIADFGLVRVETADDDAGLTDARDRLGTDAFMAPEQRAAPDAVGPAADFYSLGCVWYFLLTGRPVSRDPLSHCVVHLEKALSEVPRRCRPLLRQLVNDEPDSRVTSPDLFIRHLAGLRRKARLAELWDEPASDRHATLRRGPMTACFVAVLTAVLGFTGWHFRKENRSTSVHHELAGPVISVPYEQGGSIVRQAYYEAFPQEYTLELVDSHGAMLSKGRLNTWWYLDCVGNPLSTRIAVTERSPRPSVTVKLLPGTHKVSAMSVRADDVELPEGKETQLVDHAAVIFYVYPDLTVGPLSISKETARQGESLILSFDLTNRGTVESNPGILRTFLNPNQPSYVSGMITDTPFPVMKPDETHQVHLPIRIPDNCPVGSAFVSVVADAEDTTDERDEQEVKTWPDGKANDFCFVTKKDPKGVPPVNNRADVEVMVRNSR